MRVRSWPPNNSFKPNLLRYTNNVAGKAWHVVGYATQVGLTQALGASSFFGVGHNAPRVYRAVASASFQWRGARSGSSGGVLGFGRSAACGRGFQASGARFGKVRGLSREARTAIVGLRTNSFGVAQWLGFTRLAVAPNKSFKPNPLRGFGNTAASASASFSGSSRCGSA